MINLEQILYFPSRKIGKRNKDIIFLKQKNELKKKQERLFLEIGIMEKKEGKD